VIGRSVGGRYQLAFGHHRIEAVRRSHITEIPLITETLTDRQMLQLMGQECKVANCSAMAVPADNY
jgi:ParB-like chromosome segregation protein Spo0J